MAIIRRENKNGITYQVKIRGSDGRWMTTSFDKKSDAVKYEQKMLLRKSENFFVSSSAQKVLVNEFWEKLSQEAFSKVTEGWQKTQQQMFRDHVSPIIGNLAIGLIRPIHISNIMKIASEKGLSAQTLVHIYNLLHKSFEQAMTLYHLISTNPVLKEFKPKIPQKETAHLKYDDAIKLLNYTKEKEFGLPIWIGILAGMRVGEVEALKWSNVDLETGFIHVRSTYDRKTNKLNDYPKGKKWFSVPMPNDLWEMMKVAKKKSDSEFVCAISKDVQYQSFYDAFMWRLEKYCKECGINKIATHGLRHSAASIYSEYGATERDMQTLFAHASSATTKRYIHTKDRDQMRIGQIANAIQLFPNVPKLDG